MPLSRLSLQTLIHWEHCLLRKVSLKPIVKRLQVLQLRLVLLPPGIQIRGEQDLLTFLGRSNWKVGSEYPAGSNAKFRIYGNRAGNLHGRIEDKTSRRAPITRAQELGKRELELM